MGLFCCVLLMVTCGCESFRQSQNTYHPPALRTNRLAADAVRLEIGIAQIDTSQKETVKHFWRDLDQQELSLATRQLLDRHGLKAAVMSQRPPSNFGDLVNPREIVLEELDGFQKQLYLRGHLKATERMLVHKQVSTRQGQPHPIQTSVLHPSLSWTVETLATLNNQTSLTDKSDNNVRGVMAIRTYPQGDGSVNVTIEPQIHHGDVTQRYGATANGFKFDERQTISVLEPLEFSVSLRAGEALVIGPTAELTQLGHLFFGEVDLNQDDSLTAAADQLLAAAALATEAKPEQDSQQDRLPELDIDESKFDSIVDKLDTNAIDESMNDLLGVVSPAAREKPKPVHRMLIIRVIQTQLDDLFDQQLKTDPLSTSREF